MTDIIRDSRLVADRMKVDAAKATALVRQDGPRGPYVMLAPTTGPVTGLQAARELLGSDAQFSHITNGYPVYTLQPNSTDYPFGR